MQQCWNCGKVYDESEYAVCPYCRGGFRAHHSHRDMKKALSDCMENETKKSMRFITDEKEIV